MSDYSRKDFTGRTFIEATDLNGKEIIGSCFSQEKWREDVFPPDMSGVTFINCNLDNCHIPEGNTVIGGSNRYFEAQTDGHDWELAEDGFPTNILNWLPFYKFGITHPNPLELPEEQVEEAIDYLSVSV